MSITRKFFSLAALSLSLLVASSAHSQTAPACSAELKNALAVRIAALARLPPAQQVAAEAQLYQTYKYCATDGANVPSDAGLNLTALACDAKVTYQGSTFFEEMPCCGYDPQRRDFACPVRIKQNVGFGGSPLPGSREYVLHCVQGPGGNWNVVARDSVHLANSSLPPTWQFAVVASGEQNVWLLNPMSGQLRNARSILSWGLQPTSCQYQPIWGNVIEYKVRLDQ